MLLTPRVTQARVRRKLKLFRFITVKFFVDFAEVLVCDMSVHLGGANAAMAQHGLNTADVGTVH